MMKSEKSNTKLLKICETKKNSRSKQKNTERQEKNSTKRRPQEASADFTHLERKRKIYEEIRTKKKKRVEGITKNKHWDVVEINGEIREIREKTN